MKTNWNMYNEGKYEFVRYQWPSNDTYRDQVGCAYWQWADSYMTRYKQSPDQIAPSVAYASDTVTGYVEYWYWLNYFACPTDGSAHMSVANCAHFADVNMYRDSSDDSVNMEYLWNLADPFNEGGDPPENSLFNLDTLKELIQLGLSTPNLVYDDKDLVYELNFTLSQDWTNLANKLELFDTGEQA